MKIEQQVCSLELAEKLKKLGVKQESFFGWHKEPVGKAEGSTNSYWLSMSDPKKTFEVASAFTVAELGEMLPKKITLNGEVVFPTFWVRGTGQWALVYKNSEGHHRIPAQWTEREVDARAKMLIYLIENKLI